MNELISIVVPIYNGEHYLRECLNSLKMQDYLDIEVILIDDGSTDRTADICRQYVLDDQRFHYIYRENGGQNAARKTGVEHASGDWVMFVDSDDFVTADFCSSFIQKQRQTGAEMVCGQTQLFQDGKYGRISPSPMGLFSGEDAFRKYIQPRFFSFGMASGEWPILYRKQAILDALDCIDMRIRFSEDCGCTIFCLLHARNVAFLKKVVYFYRQISESFCHTHSKSNAFDQKLLRSFLLKVIRAINDSDKEKFFIKEINWLIIRDLLLGGYEYFSDFPGLYPFKEIPSGKRIVIYGAGVFGEEMHDKFPRNLVLTGWVDRQYAYYQSQGKPVSSVEKLPEMNFDYVVIAITNPDTVDRIVQDLLDENIPAEKILRIDEGLIDSDYTERKLKELENVDENYRYVPAAVSPDSGK